jgi:hypothetical protein
MMLLGFAGLSFAFRQSRRKVSCAQIADRRRLREDRRCGGLSFSDNQGLTVASISSRAKARWARLVVG